MGLGTGGWGLGGASIKGTLTSSPQPQCILLGLLKIIQTNPPQQKSNAAIVNAPFIGNTL